MELNAKFFPPNSGVFQDIAIEKTFLKRHPPHIPQRMHQNYLDHYRYWERNIHQMIEMLSNERMMCICKTIISKFNQFFLTDLTLISLVNLMVTRDFNQRLVQNNYLGPEEEELRIKTINLTNKLGKYILIYTIKRILLSDSILFGVAMAV